MYKISYEEMTQGYLKRRIALLYDICNIMCNFCIILLSTQNI